MVPATVPRTYNGIEGSLQAWVDLGMSEAERLKKKISAPDPQAWNRQMYNVRVFDNLIYNTDRHANNIWVTTDWTIILIDHSRSFRPFSQLRAENDLRRFSRSLLAALEKLDRATLDEKMSKYLDRYQIDALLARRDLDRRACAPPGQRAGRSRSPVPVTPAAAPPDQGRTCTVVPAVSPLPAAGRRTAPEARPT